MTSAAVQGLRGGALKNLVVNAERAAELKHLATHLPEVVLKDHHLCDFELLASGAFSPLEGYMVRADFEPVLDRMKLHDGTFWPVPVCLDVSEIRCRNLEAGQSVALRDPEGYLLAVLHIEDIWPVDSALEAGLSPGLSESGVTDDLHDTDKTEKCHVGGKLEVISLPLHYDFNLLRLTPREVRAQFEKLGWQRVVGYQINTVMHRPQFELTLKAMRNARANLCLFPVVGVNRTEDFNYYTRVRCYKKLMRHYPPDTVVLSLLPHYVRYSGPRETLLNAIVVKNYGCSHFVVCRDHHPHAGSTWDESRTILCHHAAEIGIDLIFFDEFVYHLHEDQYRFISELPANAQILRMDSAAIRERITSGREVPSWASFPEVLEELRKAFPPPSKQGFTVFLTGLSGAGKSTIAKILYSKMLEIGERPVTLLDGDIVRQNLSSELTFSREHRDINVRRIGFVACEITKNRGIAICAPIAPYEATRRTIRQSIAAHGGFIEVHVATPLEECEKRDRKGMYAKARAGLIKGYTGIDDPYEIPQQPEITIDTTNIAPEEATHEILLYLGQKGFI